MKVSTLATAILYGGVGASLLENDALAVEALAKLGSNVAQNGYPDAEKCTLDNVAVRREWSTLSEDQKLNYIDAVKCLGKKPAKTPAAIASGAKSRFDDFIVTHILQTMSIHGTGNFLSWHRYYIWVYEQALRNECGYEGYLPYNNWSKWAEDPLSSPLFDGSKTSISGDGEYVAGRGSWCIPNEARCMVTFHSANGGGCIRSGPFKDWKINLGPIQTTVKDAPPNPQADGLGYNPRCLSRDISTQASNETRDEMVVDLIKNYPDILSFQNKMQNFTQGVMGVHNGGHYTIGGDSGMDMFNSPADPAFYFHHGMIDRVWWTWQNLDLQSRQNSIAGTMTFLNNPPSRNATLDDVLSVGYVGSPNITIKDAMSTIAGPFCYVYA
ncbi:uncharacterized protein J4E88_007886 [Alternaria novae-zelandiae]|uniref:uncharacterized protein n=1 Tax=Alternaria novae-zelandiae TaxID=430562 RepID=UPI0020C57514|nr:uncharacterized protein J4E88_007886 [Alternaria novae-zelandiae]KAI4674983.1 hypothetical protein J4E88_007886 [Alternaria novae-zelandiae]